MDVVEAILAGERLPLARLLTQVENDTPAGRKGLDGLFAFTGKAHLVGVTGAPGTGKSSLVNQLANLFRHPLNGRPPLKVAVVAIDPSSPFTGGALLGDRLRMRDLAGDPGVFIRSMASRGALGGLARATADVVQVLDAAGYDVILIETVGAGQSEVDIARLAHTTIVVEAPGMGDDIQAIKAGILEIADILVVNKADRPGVENTERALKAMLELAEPAESGLNEPTVGWATPVLRTIGPQADGIEEVVQAIFDHRDFLRQSGEWLQRERSRLKNELDILLQSTLVSKWNSQLPSGLYDSTLARLCERQISPFQAVDSLLENRL
ncbi:MAG: methylmalonyl Co-A mutase-associated GTPase MeaB [Anaerolineaceae bacterium]|nr:methylmalonyl Co-A mutase-associated GTPase MeaB [Anaerolineaceae bacterium]